MKKKILVVLSILLIAAMAITGTVAYLTDEASDINVMTVGNVKIQQLEYERDANGDLQKFTQDKPIVPAVYEGSSLPWADGLYTWDSIDGVPAGAGNQLFQDGANAVDKFVFVKNTGKTDAYYRTIIAIECPEGLDPSMIHINANGNARFTWSDIGFTTIDGVKYYLKEALYNEILAPEETSRPSLLQVYLDKAATNEDLDLFGEKMEILVVSQAVQADGWSDSNTALDTAFYDVTTDAHPWLNIDLWGGSVDTAWYTGDATEYTISTAAELAGLAEIVNGGDTLHGVTINLAGSIDLEHNEWTPIGAGTGKKAFQGTFNGNGYTIYNLNVNDADGAGLFGYAFAEGKGAAITNVNVVNAEINSAHYAGVIVGHLYGDVTGCTVENAVINCVDENGEDGDKAGAIVGYVGPEAVGKYDVSGNTVKNVTITANRDAGQVAGYATSVVTVANNKIDNVTVTASGFGTGANIGGEVGRTK